MIPAKPAAILLLISAIALVVSWVSIPLFMWSHLRDQDFSALVQDPTWVPVNIALLIAAALLLPGITGLFNNLGKGASRGSALALITTQLGIAWYVCIQFYETVLWPPIAKKSPELFEAVGFSASDSLVFWQLIASGLVWSLGFTLIAVIIHRRTQRKWTSVGLGLGAILFGIGIEFLVRTLGLLMFSASLVALSRTLWRGGEQQ
jgi:hypothetical protein